MTTSNALWKKFRQGKEYREEFVAAHVKRSIPHQARALMKAKGLNQTELASRSGLSQGVVSRAVDPNYGNLTLNTIIRLAAGFEVAFIGRFVPFSELAKWYKDLPSQDFDIPNFDKEDAVRAEHVEALDTGGVVEMPSRQQESTATGETPIFDKETPNVAATNTEESVILLKRPPGVESNRYRVMEGTHV